MYKRSFLKWPGGKYRLLDKILAWLPSGKKLIEPFVGSGSVFLNSDHEEYLLSDCNADLINLYNILKSEGYAFIDYVESFFTKHNNTEDKFYCLRQQFNHSKDTAERSAIFVYLNRHDFNGMCRYNQQGFFNVPYGRYEKPYFPREEMKYFYAKAQQADFVCHDFSDSMKLADKNAVIYADPPYVPLSETAHFTEYSQDGFTTMQHKRLARIAKKLAHKGIPVLLSNHDTEFTRKAYAGARVMSFPVSRQISGQAKGRGHVKEILALFEPGKRIGN
jgi:DNA adenine methylase